MTRRPHSPKITFLENNIPRKYLSPMITYYARLGDQCDHRKVCYRVVESGPRVLRRSKKSDSFLKWVMDLYSDILR